LRNWRRNAPRADACEAYPQASHPLAANPCNECPARYNNQAALTCWSVNLSGLGWYFKIDCATPRNQKLRWSSDLEQAGDCLVDYGHSRRWLRALVATAAHTGLAEREERRVKRYKPDRRTLREGGS
jgi:hypothetical protein